MIRPLEPRVGENRSIHVIKREAEVFLREMLTEGIFPSSEAFEHRLKEVIVEIEENKVECTLWEEVNGVGCEVCMEKLEEMHHASPLVGLEMR
jgi:hypothetical protein